MSMPHHPAPATPVLPATPPRARRTGRLIGSILVFAWSLVSFFGGLVGVGYLVLGVTMTHTLDGVFGPEPGGTFNWTVLWICLVGPTVGLLAGVVVMIGSIRARNRLQSGGAAVGFGIASVSIFGLGVLTSLPLIEIAARALAL